MSTEDAKRSITGGMLVKPSSDDRKLSPSTAPTAKKIIIKNADMKDDMQKEAVDIAIAVSSLSLSYSLTHSKPCFLFSLYFYFYYYFFNFDVMI